ncbi:hypothetical protein CSIM01_06998 [Colletotrichum simmondsii]|uniref:Uncharacterized protein n=1 Tax=Colletotrichum simmondsii TaxID=703756 RepID=A0A135T0T6_9PEZI|nr:hypothetical protein CSIM01_06998 [Colletotrichum simmondsii]
MQPRERDTSNGRRTAVAALADCLESLAIVAGTLRGAANSTEKEGEKKEGKRAPTCKSRVEGVTIQYVLTEPLNFRFDSDSDLDHAGTPYKREYESLFRLWRGHPIHTFARQCRPLLQGPNHGSYSVASLTPKPGKPGPPYRHGVTVGCPPLRNGSLPASPLSSSHAPPVHSPPPPPPPHLTNFWVAGIRRLSEPKGDPDNVHP